LTFYKAKKFYLTCSERQKKKKNKSKKEYCCLVCTGLTTKTRDFSLLSDIGPTAKRDGIGFGI